VESLSQRQRRPPRRRIVITAWVAAALVVAVSITAGAILLRPTDVPAPVPRRAAAIAPRPSATPTVPPAPPKPTQEQLAAVPLAFYDGLIPALLDSTTVAPSNQWQVATPIDPLVALYATPATDATPIAALGSTVPTVDTPTAVAVYGVSGDMILVSTPARNATPAPGKPAPSATFAWARAADFTIAKITQTVMVDNAGSTISIVSPTGAVSASETARLGTPNDPTPAATWSYIESIYTDALVAYTHGNPISLTGAHSSTLAGFGGNSALTALHFYPDATGSSHGCVRVSAAMTKSLAALPVGTPVIFD
jgi:hypothetical protein